MGPMKERGLVIIDTTMACDLSFSVFFLTKMMEMKQSSLGIEWENTVLCTEFAHNFCAGIGPLQLGVVLVYYISNLDI